MWKESLAQRSILKLLDFRKEEAPQITQSDKSDATHTLFKMSFTAFVYEFVYVSVNRYSHKFFNNFMKEVVVALCADMS